MCSRLSCAPLSLIPKFALRVLLAASIRCALYTHSRLLVLPRDFLHITRCKSCRSVLQGAPIRFPLSGRLAKCRLSAPEMLCLAPRSLLSDNQCSTPCAMSCPVLFYSTYSTPPHSPRSTPSKQRTAHSGSISLQSHENGSLFTALQFDAIQRIALHCIVLLVLTPRSDPTVIYANHPILDSPAINNSPMSCLVTTSSNLDAKSPCFSFPVHILLYCLSWTPCTPCSCASNPATNTG
jgi:hypothetical protein